MIAADDQFEPDDPNDAALDQLLTQARWPAPTPEAEERVRAQWLAISHRRRMKPLVWTLAAAASMALAIGGTLFVSDLKNSMIRFPDDRDNAKYLAVETPIEQSAPLIESRPANLMERLALLQGSPPVNHAAVASVVPVENVNDSSGADDLLRQLGAHSVEDRFAAAQALAKLEDPRVINALVDLVKKDVHRREALLALQLSKSSLAAEALKKISIPRASEAQLAADTRWLQSGL